MELHHDECTRPNCSQSILTGSVPELLEQIITQFMRDPNTTFDQLKSLRLVCKSFNYAAAPRVLHCVRLFGLGERSDSESMSSMRQLKAIVSPDLNGHLHETKTLVMANWKWTCRLFLPLRETRYSGVRVSVFIFNSTVVPLMCLLTAIFAPHSVHSYIRDSVVHLRTRHRFLRASLLGMPNVRRVVWIAKPDDPSWVTSGTVRLLLEFRQLSELELFIKGDQDMEHIAKGFSRLHNLRKLKIKISHWFGVWDPSGNWPHPINVLGRIIGENLNLTHLELFQDDFCPNGGNLSEIFGYVPANSPLKLEHLGLSDHFSDAQAIVSHARSLRSISLRASRRLEFEMLSLLYAERIFPPIIETTRIDDLVINYLNHHPQIVGFSMLGWYLEVTGRTVLETIAQHSETLKYLSIISSWFFPSLDDQTEHFLLRCTKLEQLTIWYRYDHSYCSQTDHANLNMGLPIIARLSSSLTLAISCFPIFEVCIEYCSRSENPLLRDLSKRIVYEPFEPF